MNYLLKQSLYLILIISFSSCDLFMGAKNKHHSYMMSSFSKTGIVFYNYKYPDYVKDLDEELIEISGLAYDSINNKLYANNDEKGNVYSLDVNGFNIISKDQFWNTGDYEGIEFDGEYIWILKSNGNLYKFDPIENETIEYETKLSSNNDVEGLCFDSDKKVMYLACKGITLEKDEKLRTKAIYIFDIKDEKLLKEPLLTIHPRQIKKFIEQIASSKVDENYMDRVNVFSPSALAMNKNKDLYILSARGSMLVVIDLNSNIKEVTFFNPRRLPQPEGICFDNENNLYVSTEGKSDKGKLVMFKVRKL